MKIEFTESEIKILSRGLGKLLIEMSEAHEDTTDVLNLIDKIYFKVKENHNA